MQLFTDTHVGKAIPAKKQKQCQAY